MAVSGSDWDNSIQVLVDEREGNISDRLSLQYCKVSARWLTVRRLSLHAVLQGLSPFAVHITFMAHIMNLVGESFRAPFKDINACAYSLGL